METIRDIKTLLGTSGFELVIYTVSALLCILFLATNQLWTSAEMSEYAAYFKMHPSPAFEQYQAVNEVVNRSKIAADMSVFIFWSMTGLLGYMLLSQVYKMYKGSVELIEEVIDVHQNRAVVIHEAVHTFTIRTIAITLLAAWLFLGKQYLLGLLIASLHNAGTFEVIPLLVVGIVLFMFVLWLHGTVSLLRLFFMRRRLFLPQYHL